MAERLRTLLERPLDPGVARAVVLLALAVSTGFAVLVLLGAVGRDGPHAPIGAVAGADRAVSPAARSVPQPTSGGHPEADSRRHSVGAQDRQDRTGTETHRRALREADRHRALQHVPYHRGAVTITLVGARGARAILAVDAPTVDLARRGYRRFLHRFDDPGTAYLPRFGRRPPSRRSAR